MSTNAPNPFESPLHQKQIAGTDTPKKRTWSVFAISVLVIVTLGLLVALLMPARRCAREAARRAGCINNVRQIQLAISNYEAAFGHLPPAYTVDAEGNRLHSWRTLILPFIEEGELHKTIDLTKPWDHPANATAREASITPYLCPSAWCGDGKTTYMAIVGPDYAFTGSVGQKSSELHNSSKTAAIMEIPSDMAIHWMSPHDADGEFLKQLSEDTEINHDRVFMVSFLDGHVTNFAIDALDLFRDNLPDFKDVNMDAL